MIVARLVGVGLSQSRRQREAQLLAEFARRKTRRHQAVGEKESERLFFVDPRQAQLRQINLREALFAACPEVAGAAELTEQRRIDRRHKGRRQRSQNAVPAGKIERFRASSIAPHGGQNSAGAERESRFGERQRRVQNAPLSQR
ncbi:hypothetical protein [Methylocella sp.]|uniref:hypothetical protein n=1 Tax=Methylocella sp. TaxID=1978226 RepID=UPI003C14C102